MDASRLALATNQPLRLGPLCRWCSPVGYLAQHDVAARGSSLRHSQDHQKQAPRLRSRHCEEVSAQLKTMNARKEENRQELIEELDAAIGRLRGIAKSLENLSL